MKNVFKATEKKLISTKSIPKYIKNEQKLSTGDKTKSTIVFCCTNLRNKMIIFQLKNTKIKTPLHVSKPKMRTSNAKDYKG